MKIGQRFIVLVLLLTGLGLTLESVHSQSREKSESEKSKTKRPRSRKRTVKRGSRPVVGRGGSTVQLPTFGVAIDPNGLLSVEAIPDPTGRLQLQRAEAARAVLQRDLQQPVELRKVSLVRLAAAISQQLKAGKPPTETMRNLAGLKRIQYVFVYPESKDIVIAGPAEGFCRDALGRPVGVDTNEPIIQLEHLAVALRAFAPGKQPQAFIGCTIDPTREALEKLREFQGTIPRTVRQNQRSQVSQYVAQGTRRSLGMSPIRVFGISAKTTFAQIMVEADFRMKRIGIGLEPTPVKMVTFIDALRQPPKATLQRWWFTPNYRRIQLAGDQLALGFVGEGVQLKSEDYRIQPDGTMVASGQNPGKASQLYATAFTRKYAEIATVSPVFAQLRTLVDLSVMAAFLQRSGAFERVEWDLGCLGNEQQLPVEVHPVPQQVAAVVNVVWKGNRMVSPAGGVSIQPLLALKRENLIADPDQKLTLQRNQLKRDPQRWWWD